MKPIINCINLVGGSLPIEISERLAIESVHLFRSSNRRRNFGGEFFEGRIETRREEMAFLIFSGIRFDAEVEFETEDGRSRKVKVLFIVHHSVLGMDFGQGYEFAMYPSADYDPVGTPMGSC